MGHQVDILSRLNFARCPAPPIRNIRLSVLEARQRRSAFGIRAPRAAHRTEGPLANWPRALRDRTIKLPFTTAITPAFPNTSSPHRIPLAWTYRFLRWFHGPCAP